MLLDNFLSRPEGKTLEFKRDLSSPKPIMKTIVAFANTAGGSLILGVDDQKQVFGIEDPISAEEKLTSLIADHIAPTLLPTITILPADHTNVLWVKVPCFPSMGPFYLKQEGVEKGTMVRLGSTTRLASPEMIEELRRRRQVQCFDEEPCTRASLKDLDQALLKRTFKNAGQKITPAKLKTLKILVPYGDEDIPSNAGILLFGKELVRDRVFPMASVSCARFAGTEKVNFLDRLDIPSIIAAAEEVPNFIRRNTRMGAVIKEIRRKDIPEYPTVAVREGLLNALMHADYSYNLKIFVSIFDDRLEIRSPGCLPPGMTIEGIKEGMSMPRNYTIARIFQVLGWVEQFGTGYRRIKEACEEGRYPLPEWKELGPYTDIIFKPIKMESIHEDTSRDPVGTQSGPSQDDDQLLQLCYEAKSTSELMSAMNWKHRTKFRRRFLMPLVAQGLLAITIPDKPNSRLQKYQTTEKGRQYLARRAI